MTTSRDDKSFFLATSELLESYRMLLVGSSSWAFRFWLTSGLVRVIKMLGGGSSKNKEHLLLKWLEEVEDLPILYKRGNIAQTWALGRIWDFTDIMESEINAYALFRNQRVVEIELRNIQTALKDFRGQLPNRPSKIRLGLVGSLLSFVIVAGLSAIPVAGVILKYVSLIPFPVLFVALAIAIIAGEFLAIRWLVGFSFDAPMYWSLQKKLDISEKEDQVREHLRIYVVEMGRSIFNPAEAEEQRQED